MISDEHGSFQGKDAFRKRKPKTGGWRAPAFIIVVLLLIGAAVGVLLLLNTGALIAPGTVLPGAEVLTVPFDQDTPTVTSETYSGRVELLIEGAGQASGPNISDAFYVFADADGHPLLTREVGVFGLRIDEQRAWQALGLSVPPPYTPTHAYRLIYDVGREARPIAFRVDDEVLGDNSGTFTVQVRPAPAE